ncbi:isoprenylcysteine carboxylmethyltransferase family protein [Propionibacterium australiense]|nr:isoprenylcysteine carboxylmethyltransferase family protein [Propionibacterium australiense]RLP13125.1 isoprenylcysteine carboxylmethyltransferase family protein [Propionibacterium australiense]
MDARLLGRAVGRCIAGLVLILVLLLVPAGTTHYWNAWLLTGLLFVPMLVVGIVLMLRDPELLRKRLSSRETEPEQQQVIALSGLMFVSAFVLAGLNHRFGWLAVPAWGVWAATAIYLLAISLYAEVLRENAYLSRTVEVQDDQKVIDTGLYGIVRHPMYSATVLLFLALPWILGSPISFLVLLLYIPIIAKRIRNEEKVLEAGLDGYVEYKNRVRRKVIPLVW